MPMDMLLTRCLPLLILTTNLDQPKATKDPIVLITFLFHLSIKTFNPKNINPNFDKPEDAKDIEDEDWEGLEGDREDGRTQKINDQSQQAE